jgi:hypothetical protein
MNSVETRNTKVNATGAVFKIFNRYSLSDIPIPQHAAMAALQALPIPGKVGKGTPDQETGNPVG